MLLVPTSQQLGAQNTTRRFFADSITNQKIMTLKHEFGAKKTFIKEYEAQILTALSYYPELKNVEIIFRLKKTNTPLTSKPSFVSLFRAAKNRKYIVTISEQTNPYLEPILFKNLNFNAQIGVLGHELSHISNYIHKGFGKMFHIIEIEIFSKKQVDSFEYNTDLTCISHGLGYQLLDWSLSVRQNLGKENWRGANNIVTNPKKKDT